MNNGLKARNNPRGVKPKMEGPLLVAMASVASSASAGKATKGRDEERRARAATGVSRDCLLCSLPAAVALMELYRVLAVGGMVGWRSVRGENGLYMASYALIKLHGDVRSVKLT